MTFLYDPAKAMQVLLEMEAGWGGTPQQRQAARYRSYAERYGVTAPRAGDEADLECVRDRADSEAARPQAINTEATQPRPEPDIPASAPAPRPDSPPAAAPAPAPVATPAPQPAPG